MPRKVDHAQRRREIAAAVSRIARRRGLEGVSFREVASEAGVSVSLVQHYFGTKDNLLVTTIDIQSERLATLIGERLADVSDSEGAMARVRTIAMSFIPSDDESRDAMLVYHTFAGAALTDPKLRSADAFRNADALMATIADELRSAKESGQLAPGVDPVSEAQVVLSLILGLSLTILLDQKTPSEASSVLEGHLDRLVA